MMHDGINPYVKNLSKRSVFLNNIRNRPDNDPVLSNYYLFLPEHVRLSDVFQREVIYFLQTEHVSDYTYEKLSGLLSVEFDKKTRVKSPKPINLMEIISFRHKCGFFK